MIDWFLKCLSIRFRSLFFRAGDVFFDFRVFIKFVKYLLSLIILMENDSVENFAFIGKKWFDGRPEFLIVCNTFEV